MVKAPKTKGRYRDRLLGMIVRVSVNGEFVKEFATNDRLFELERAEEE